MNFLAPGIERIFNMQRLARLGLLTALMALLLTGRPSAADDKLPPLKSPKLEQYRAKQAGVST